ncbi:MAG: hypothetical protein DDT40_00438 [candidate division WS2 bacterium]|uniref:Uncharacterized protein n=1 Tax=Psychracetigena formicireducens TaxID=2986056 RepID=A0A9E2BGR4_PSYF1|nr:hypothetical protein [Candidatus Psychracetigena formicireducens]MBT9145217.1 hypothetical protein [Candidatus Psychracetigena formicireducens]MBT9150270.1 hypothetical protein [Candidatus Psychracetigena formicireducens]
MHILPALWKMLIDKRVPGSGPGRQASKNLPPKVKTEGKRHKNSRVVFQLSILFPLRTSSYYVQLRADTAVKIYFTILKRE